MNRIYNFINHNKLYIIAYFIIILGCYFPVIINTYAFADDWSKIYYSINHTKYNLWAEISAGRPLYGFLIFLSQKYIFLPDSLSLFKVLGILSIMFFSLFFFYYLKTNDYFNSNSFLQFLLPLTLAVSPPLYLFAAWYTCWPFSLAVLTSFVAFYLLTCTPYPSKMRILLSLFTLMVSFSIYQSAALLFLLYLSLYIGNREHDIKIIFIAICICVFSMIFSLFLVKIISPLLGYAPQPRSSLKYDITNAIKFFWMAAFPYGIKALFLSNINSIGIAICSLVWMYSLFTYTNHRFNAFILILVSLMISFSPTLLTNRYLSIRASITVISFILTFLMLGVSRISPWEKLNNALALILSIFIIINTTVTFYNDFIFSNQKDFRQLSNLIEPYLKNPPYCVNINLENAKSRTSKKTFHFVELGLRSSYFSWANQGMLSTIYFLNDLPTKVIQNNPNCVNVLQRSLDD